MKLKNDAPTTELTFNEPNKMPIQERTLATKRNRQEDLNADESDEIILIKGEGDNLFDDTFMNIHISFI